MTTRRIPPSTEYPLLFLTNRSGLRIHLFPDGRLFDLRCGSILINQVLPTLGEHGLMRLYLRDRGEASPVIPLMGPKLSESPANEITSSFRQRDERSALWEKRTNSLEATLILQLHEIEPAWMWSVRIRNVGDERQTLDLLYGQDLGLAHEGFVRMNEAYCSQYIDHRVVEDAEWGPVLLSRQNQAQEGQFPWIAQGCLNGSAAWSTDGYQFFGGDHRLTGRPAALTFDALPCINHQYEFAYPALQSPTFTLEPGAETTVRFFVAYRPDHASASSEADLERLHLLLDGFEESTEPLKEAESERHASGPPLSTLFESPWLHGEEFTGAEWIEHFPGEHRHIERDAEGALLSFFTDDHRHVVSRRKEGVVERPHAHILRSGNSLWLDDNLLGTTVGMAGIFNAQVFLGNTNLARFLSVIRNPLGVMRGSGQRIFVKVGDGWQQLGVPSAFEMGLRSVRWLYKTGEEIIQVTTRAAENAPRLALEIRVLKGPARAFLLSHMVVMGDNEMTQPFSLSFDEAEARIEARPDEKSLLGEKWPHIRFIIEANPVQVESVCGDELLFSDGQSRGGPYAVVVTQETDAFVLRLRGENDCAVQPSNAPPSLPRLLHSEEAVRRINDLLPWFAHDAWIHFTAPHGLEQYGGAAWGTRDVCQGPVEWLIAARQYETVRRILLQVFEQQYESDGSWPQWFMFEPFRFIQSLHSHGDIVFWPLKALCDYIEASNDFSILDEEAPYTDPAGFISTPHRASLAAHVEKILSQHDARCLPDTALVNYGDGDWDDTLQPADPRLRSHMASAWTVGLAYDAFRRYRAVCERAGLADTAERLNSTLERIHSDFHRLLMPDGITAGFAVFEEGTMQPLLHPQDQATGIRYRLLPMTRSVLAELFTPEEAQRHAGLIRENLLFPDGVRLMSDPIPYRGGVEHRFKRAETAANFGREVGLMYSHAHLRYAEALAKLGDADGLWRAMQTVNPIGIKEAVPNAAIRQANVYFTSSDGAFNDRYEAQRNFEKLREGSVPVKGGWRLYSSGPGLFIHKVITQLLGLRESFGDVVIDPVLPSSLDGLTVEWEWNGRPLEVIYHVEARGFAPSRVTLNNQELPVNRRDANPYRESGVRIAADLFESLLSKDGNRMAVYL
jgi:CRISPR-associated protein Csx3